MDKKIILILAAVALITAGAIGTSISIGSFDDLPEGTKETIVKEPAGEVVLVEHEILINDINGLTSISKVIDCERFLDKAEQEVEINRIIQISIDESYSSFSEGAEVAVKIINITGTSYTGQKDMYYDWTTETLKAVTTKEVV